MVKLYFTGIKHSGKTTQARLVAGLLSMPYADSDDLILSDIDMTIREYYKAYGKSEFMKRELEAVSKYTESNDDFILSLGGGASDNTPLINLMKDNGRIIYLRREESEMLPVILKHGIPAFLDSNDLEGSFHRVYTERDRIYMENSDLAIDLGHYRDKAETAEYVLEKLKENGYV